MLIYCLRRNDAIHHAAQILQSFGLPVTDTPDDAVSHLLLPVPSSSVFPELQMLLSKLSTEVVISGGNLDAGFLKPYRTVDFLKDPFYLAYNAAITARCAQTLAEEKSGEPLSGRPVLILGWGRIGKCLARNLRADDADVTVAARKESDLAILRALGYRAIPISQAGLELNRYRFIFNTVPAMILPDIRLGSNCTAIELASTPGMAGDGIIPARGLPGKMAPEESGKLIAETFIRLSLRKED